jgi:hypothetical protein
MLKLDLWYEEKDEALAGKALCALAQKHREGFSRRKARACALLGIYEGLDVDRFAANAYDTAGPYMFDRENRNGDPEDGHYRQTHNLGARIMDAVDAKIFALERTKTAFVMSEGGWKVKSAGIKAARFIEGQMTEPQGLFKDMWELWRQAARLTTIATSAAMVFFWSDPDQGKIVAELDDTLNVFVETSGLPYDGFSSIGRITFWDPEKLALRYPEHAEAIRQQAISPEHHALWRELYSEDAEETNDAGVLRVPLVQGWRMRHGDPDDGGIEGVELSAIPGLTLERKDYPYDYAPCVRFCPMPQLAGKWGRTILERAVDAIRRYNEILNSIDLAERLTPKAVVFYDPTTTDPALMEKVKDVIAIPYTGPSGSEPKYTPLDPVSAVVLEILKLHKDAAYDLTGMNEAYATMNIGDGMSGVAIRLIKQEVYEMFAPFEDEFTRCVGPETAKQIMRCARELQKQGGFTSIWKGGGEGGWLKEISADVFDILEDQTYRTAPQPVSGSQNSPADRVALAEELVQVGIITGEAYAQILQDYNTFGHTQNELSLVEAQFIEKQIDMWLFDDIEAAKKRTISPEIWMDRDLAMTLKVGAAYLQARMDMIEDRGEAETEQRLGFFKTYLSQLTKNAQDRAAFAAQAQAAANPAAPAQPAAAQPGPPSPAPAPAQLAA